jgi:hypothetical protein
MAKATTAKAPKKAKRKTPKALKAVVTAAPKAGKKAKQAASNAADALWKLADHPLVGELLAIGATAAVVALAEGGASGKSKKKNVSAKAVKTAGKAAAEAIGARLITEFTDVRKTPKSAKAAKPKAARPKAGKPKAGRPTPAKA